jgi:LmbE family N-acetylglucosaminyl deacetylase
MSEIENQFGRTLIVVAHPDDEVIGCGLLLQRLKHATVAFMTDGAPADPYFWGKFGSRRAYAELRARETQDALAALRGVKTLRFGVRDQELMFHLDAALEWLRKKVQEEKPRSIVTHAYEGGHPDHDCCSFLCAMMEREFDVPVWEMPMYCRAGGKLVRQRALANAGAALNLNASAGEEMRKKEMIAAYQSQDEFITSFDMATEKFFLRPQHDYSRPPHKGKLNYECWGWEVTGHDLCAAFDRVVTKEEIKRAQSA